MKNNKHMRSEINVLTWMVKSFFVVALCASWSLYSQNSVQFQVDYFPSKLIDSNIIVRRGLEEKMNSLSLCEWSDRIGKKVDVFWLQTDRGNFFGHVYEYFMDCDNVRLIYWSPNGADIYPIVDFMIEDLEDNSMFVSSKRRYLKNKKKYKKYLE